LLVLALTIADRLGRADDKRTNLIARLEVANEGAARAENLVIGVRCNHENPLPLVAQC
jgi:hypothetical protein